MIGAQYHEEQEKNDPDGCESISAVEQSMSDRLFVPNPREYGGLAPFHGAESAIS